MSTTCEVCGVNCRGKCGKCSARLCAAHKPKSGWARCAICNVQKHGNYGRQTQTQRSSTANQGTAYYTPRTRPDFENMQPDEVLAFFYGCKGRLEAKRIRERNYLDRRAARGAHTPTDDAYEADQLLEFDLLDLLDFLAKKLGEI